MPRPHPSRSGDFAQKAQFSLRITTDFTPFRQEFQTANEIVGNSIFSLLIARSYRNFKYLLQLLIRIRQYISRVGLPVLSGFGWLAEL